MNLPALALLPLALIALQPLPAQDGAKTVLKITATKGAAVAMAVKTRQEQSIDLGGQQMDAGHELTHDLDAKVVDAAADGSLTVEVTIARIRGAFELPMMGSIDFDTRPAGKDAPKEDEADDAGGFGMPSAASIRAAMIEMTGKPIQARVSPFGKVTELTGIEPMLKAAREKAGEMGAQVLRGALDESVLKTMLGGVFGPRPKEPIAVGGSWDDDETPPSGGMQTRRKTTMTLSRCDGSEAEIAIAGTVEAKAKDPKAPAAEGDNAMMADAKIENGKITGKAIVSQKDGFVVRSESVANMDITAPSPMGGGEMSIKVKTTTIVERRKPDAAATDEAPAKKASAPGK